MGNNFLFTDSPFSRCDCQQADIWQTHHVDDPHLMRVLPLGLVKLQRGEKRTSVSPGSQDNLVFEYFLQSTAS